MEVDKIKYPEIEVKLIGTDGNAFAIIGKVRKALRRAEVDTEKIKEFQDEVTSGDYNKVISTCCKWVNVI